MKRYFEHFVAFNCTESDFNASVIHGVPLKDALLSAGFDLSELTFNQPFIANFSKGRSGFISTIAKPDASHIYVFDKWDADIFFAFCCQTSSPKILVGEYYIDKDNKFRRAVRTDASTVDGSPRAELRKAGLLHLLELYRKRSGDASLFDKVDTMADLRKLSLPPNRPTRDKSGAAMSKCDILKAMQDKTEVYYGVYWKEEKQVWMYPAFVLGMTADSVLLDCEMDDTCSYTELFASPSDFAKHIIQLT